MPRRNCRQFKQLWGEVQGFFAAKRASCIECEFFRRAAQEESPAYLATPALRARPR